MSSQTPSVAPPAHREPLRVTTGGGVVEGSSSAVAVIDFDDLGELASSDMLSLDERFGILMAARSALAHVGARREAASLDPDIERLLAELVDLSGLDEDDTADLLEPKAPEGLRAVVCVSGGVIQDTYGDQIEIVDADER